MDAVGYAGRVLLLTTWLFWSDPLLAFEMVPELQFFVPREQSAIEAPDLYSGEYYSDIRSFMRRPLADDLWLRSDKALVASVGSLNGQRFGVEQSLKARHSMSESTRLGIVYLRQQNLLATSENALLEISQTFAQRWRFSLLGNIQSDKNELDIGMRAEFLPSASVSHGVAVFWPEFSHNKRVQGTDRFSVQPLSVSWQSVWLRAQRGYRQVFARLEPMLSWDFPDRSENYRFRKWTAGWRELLPLDEDRWLSWQWEWSDQFEDQQISGTNGSRNRWSRQLLSTEVAWNQSLRRGWQPNRVGGRLHGARWHNATEQQILQYTLLPFIEYEFINQTATRMDTYAFEYEQAIHWQQDRAQVIFGDQAKWTVDHRLNFHYRFRWSPTLMLGLVATIDIDRFGTGGTWEGGGGQLYWAL